MTKHHTIIIDKLRANGERITPMRVALVEILLRFKQPLTSQELLVALAKRGFEANKTTVYRQLEMLASYDLVKVINFADRAKLYELTDGHNHHHHLVCRQCGCVEDVSFPADLTKQEQIIWKQHRFKVFEHQLEFFGICRSCLAKSDN
ncbi:MAG: Fur family transcriptional regulator [bacterium]|nr:Fur family transcriptional regulator [bacterium]